MHHYIGLTWKRDDISASLNALRLRNVLGRSTPSWDIVLDSDTLMVYSRTAVDPAMRAYVLKDSGGVIFGRLFRSGSPNHPVDTSELIATKLCRGGGKGLLEDYWGSYVAILPSPKEETIFVIRDCSGRVPCYYINLDGLYVFFSDVRDIAPFGLRFTLNPGYLASYIFHYPLHVRETGLQEVSELLAGDALSISPLGTSHECLWNPRLISGADVLRDYEQAESQLTSVTEHAIGLWAQLYERILLKLSGGLDSAIVLGCLKRLNYADRVVCVNDYTEGTDDDERAYARAAARMAGVPLIELPRVSDPRVFVERLHRIPPDPKPDVPKAVRMVALDETNELAKHFHCDTVWTGQGGDHVFLQAHNPYSAVDYLLQNRLPYRLPAALYDAAILSRHSLWSVLAQTLRYWCARTVPPDPFEFSGASLMTDSLVAEMANGYVAAAWHVGPGHPPPGKQTQIDIFLDLLNRHKPLIALECPYECHPLISQPLLELSLRIPTYHLLRGGRPRAMARAAFADRVPRCILSREDKGSTQDQARALIRGGGDLLRETLLEGTLVSLGILDRASLEKIIVTKETFRPTEIFALFGCIVVEMWAKHWPTHLTHVAAA